ncbi:immunoglobulin lambda-1 light chain-like isoform X2 [Heptranchias perlo]|uniref:immunoglobulin lambda-1 light chain-like isoform X2 n=1 Tax=Heptranchias perlo TaxID=212740 RepID=UPI00355A3B8E
MSVRAVPQFIWVLGITCTVAIDAQFQVSQAPETMSALVGSNITVYCTFPIFQDNSDVNVYWWKLGESNFLQTVSESRNRFLIFKQGGASFHLLNISARDSGVYYCGVRNLGARIVNGTGSTIKVSVPPTPLRIFTKVPEVNSSSLNLVCKTDNFYPEALSLTWYKDGIEIVIGIETTTTLNIDGLYEVSSLLKETQPLRSRAIYTCQVSHLTLPAPANVTFTVQFSKLGDNNTSKHLLISGCTGGGLTFLLLAFVIGSRRQLKIRNGAGRSVESSGRHEERTKQARADNKLTYAAFELNGSKKTGMPKAKDKNTEYAELRTTTQKGVTAGIHTDAKDP